MSCGTCRECCINLKITSDEEEEQARIKKWVHLEGLKPAGIACSSMKTNRLANGGCSIHSEETKPKLCSDYQCLFATGNLGTSKKVFRPDNLGVIFDFVPGDITTLRILEVRPKAIEQMLFKKTLWSIMAELDKENKDYCLKWVTHDLIGKETVIQQIKKVEEFSIAKKKLDEE